MSKKWLLLGGGAIVIAAAVITPYFCGNAVHAKFDAMTSDINGMLLDSGNYAENSYEKGWFSSTAKSIFHLKNGQEVIIKHDIIHGPWRYFGVGKVESKIEYPNQGVESEVKKLFSNEDPVSLTTGLGFSDSWKASIYSPVVNKQPLPFAPSVVLEWGGINGTISVGSGKSNTDISIPKLSIGEKSNLLQLEDLTLKVMAPHFANDWISAATKSWAGESVLNIKSFIFNSKKGDFKSNIHFTVVTADENSKEASVTASLKLKDLQLPQQVAAALDMRDVVEFSIKADGLPKKPIAALMQKIDETQQNKKTLDPMALMSSLQDVGMAYLTGTPSISVQTLSQGKDGKIKIEAVAKLDGPSSASNPFALLQGLQKRLVITISPSFSESLLDNAAARGLLPIDKNEFVAKLTENNRFILKNGEYSGEFRYERDMLLSNGTPDPGLQEILQYVMRIARF